MNEPNLNEANAGIEVVIKLDRNISHNQLGDFEIGLSMWIEVNCHSPVLARRNYGVSTLDIPKSITIKFDDQTEAVLFKLSDICDHDIIRKD